MSKKINKKCPYCGEEEVEEVNGRYHCEWCGHYFDSFDEPSEDDDIPEGCAACGGPYPYCKTSCKMFDD